MPPYILQSETDWRDSYRKIDRGRKTVGCHVLRQSPRRDQPQRRLSGGQRLSGKLVRWSSSGACPTQYLRCQIRQVEHRRLAHFAGKVAVSGIFVHQKAVWHPAKTDAPPGCGERDLRYGCRIVRLGDSRERKKRPHLVKKLNHKSIKEGIQMKQNRIFDQNSSQKARSWHYNMDTNRAEAQFADGSAIAIDCLAIEDEYGNTPAQRAELDWLLYNKPLECVQLVLSGEIEHYLSLGCDHGKLKD